MNNNFKRVHFEQNRVNVFSRLQASNFPFCKRERKNIPMIIELNDPSTVLSSHRIDKDNNVYFITSLYN